jgi:hypothetical protein
LRIFSICWYAPAEQPLPKLAEANKILANGSSVKWPSKPTDPIKQKLKNFKNQQPPVEMASAPSRGHPHTPSSAGGR